VIRTGICTFELGRLFVVFAALAILIAPMSISEASAANPAHDQMMSEMSHCQMPASGSKNHDRMLARLCCMAVGMAVPTACPAPDLIKPGTSLAATSRVQRLHAGILGELPTPPPRRS
jgi:hypothetical protein